MDTARRLSLMLILLSLCAAVAGPLRAQEAKDFELHGWSGLGHNLTDNLYGHLSTTLTWHQSSQFDLGGGVRFRSPRMLSLQAVPTVKFPLKKGALLLQNRYIYQAWISYNIQEVNTVLSVGYTSPRWRLMLGFFNKFYSNIHTPFRNVDYVFEPLNLAYDIEVWLFKTFRKWNISMRLCNVDDFQAERFYSPITIYTLRYRPYDWMSFYVNLRNHNAGIFDLTQNYYEHSFNLGTLFSW